MKYRLVIFTDAFPFGRAETFLEAELPRLCERFDEIVLAPLRRYSGDAPRPVPDGVTVQSPLLPGNRNLALLRRGLLNAAPLGPSLREFFRARVWSSPLRFRKWLEAVCVIRYALSRNPFAEWREEKDAHSVFYSYWANGWAWSLPFPRLPGPVVARFHGVDLYEERKDNGGYLPFRRMILDRLDEAVCISEHGRAYLSERYPDSAGTPRLFRLGVEDRGVSAASADEPFRVVSCARMVRLKRLDLLANALKSLSFKIEWTHLGDGPEMALLKDLMKDAPETLTWSFPGWLSQDEIGAWYGTHPVDLFVNVSETEGAPVSVMEALSAGVPVLATSVGGTPELVDDSVGERLPADLTVETLAEAIAGFRDRPESERNSLRSGARARWAERADAGRNYDAFADFLRGLVS